MKRFFVILLFSILATVSVVCQIPKKMSGMTEDDREKWFKILKWDQEDYFAPNINRFENSGVAFYKLGTRKWLVEIISGAGAYQRNYVYSVLNTNKRRWSVSKPLRFVSYYYDEHGKIGREASKFVVGMSSFDESRHELTIYYKGSGLGYCGSLTKYKFDGDSAKTVEARIRSCNSSAIKWPPPEKWSKVRLF